MAAADPQGRDERMRLLRPSDSRMHIGRRQNVLGLRLRFLGASLLMTHLGAASASAEPHVAEAVGNRSEALSTPRGNALRVVGPGLPGIRPLDPARGRDVASDTKPPAEPSSATTGTEELPATAAVPGDTRNMALFLDRLMIAESGGRDTARNPRSTALGAFQFIASTFLSVAQRHFAEETAKLSPRQILALRTDRAFARRAAEAYTRDNAAFLASAGLKPTYANLRLAFFAGPEGARRILLAPPETPAVRVLGRAASRANPFLARMTAADLTAWSARNLAAADIANRALAVSGAVRPKGPSINVRCDRALASCRRWISLALRRAKAAERRRIARESGLKNR